MSAPTTGKERLGFWTAPIVVGVSVAVFVVLKITATSKIAFYVDALERGGVLYFIPVLAAVGLFIVLAYPRLTLYAAAFLLPFNFVGGAWGSDMLAVAGKGAVNAVFVAAVVCTLIAPPRSRDWLMRTKFGAALIAWLGVVLIGIVLGFLSTPRGGDWIRESSWLVLYAFALPVGTLLRDRRDLGRLLGAMSAGAAVLLVLAFWLLATGTRFSRDAWAGGGSFFRAPFSSQSVFLLFLALAALFFLSSGKQLTRAQRWMLIAAIALLSGGLLAAMGRSLWISSVVGFAVVLALVPWNRRSARAAVGVAASVPVAVLLVVAVDSLAPQSSGQWTNNAIAFLMDLGSKDSASRVTRALEWSHAITVWTSSPLVGLGFGYPFPQSGYDAGATVLADPFYIHNSYLNVLAKCGVFGLAALLWAAALSLRSALQTSRDGSATLHDRVLATAVAASMFQMLTLGLFTPVLTTSDSVMFFGMLLGLAAAHRRMRLQDAAFS